MKNVLVTGGCGFLGSWIVRQLVEERGATVRVLAVEGESRENIEDLDVEVVEGDVRRVADCRAAVEGVDTVFHTAALYLDYAPDPSKMYDVNLRGTFNVLEAARRADVDKVIYTASMASLGRPELGRTGDETTAYDGWDLDFPYGRSKFFSREIAEYFADWGQDVRVVCPGVVLGPGDLRPTPSGGLILASFAPGPSAYYEGGAAYVDVRDAALVHLLAAERGRAGERYLATSENLTNKEFIDLIRRVARATKPLIRLPVPVARTVAQAMDIHAKVTGEPPLLSKTFFEFSLRPSFYRNDKARSELDAHFRPIEDSVRDAIEYFRERGMIAA